MCRGGSYACATQSGISTTCGSEITNGRWLFPRWDDRRSRSDMLVPLLLEFIESLSFLLLWYTLLRGPLRHLDKKTLREGAEAQIIANWHSSCDHTKTLKPSPIMRPVRSVA